MKHILVIGLGSMGKRRIRLLQQNFSPVRISGVDTNKIKLANCIDEYKIEGYISLKEAFAKGRNYNCAFICTSPLSHNMIIHQCLEHKVHVFTEINLTNEGYEDNIRLASQNNLTLFLSSTMIYRAEMEYLYHVINRYPGKVSYNYHVGQYLPDWHPWENYRDFFVGDRRTNGCREILAIELPWILRVFGKVEDIKVVRSKLTDLQIDYEDCYQIILSHENGSTGMLMVELAAREAVRELKIVAEDIFFQWSGTPDSFQYKNIAENRMEKIDLYKSVFREKEYNQTIVENQYVNEMIQFFKEVEEKVPSIYGFNEDIETLKVIDRIEKE